MKPQLKPGTAPDTKPEPTLYTIEAANIRFDVCGTPVSTAFEDFYFSTDNGLQESEYVFIKANGLPERWLEPHSPSQPQANFVIAETGFGTGLNFLTSWNCFNQCRANNASATRQLHFISFEKYPLTKTDLTHALAQWSELSELSIQLIEQYPKLLPGCHRIMFNAPNQGSVILDLWFGDVKDTLPLLFHGKSGYVDAWYLDGFAPSKNADLWCPQVYQGMITLSKPGATLATFTAASIVRKGLQAAGFTIKKITGFGKKREMLTGSVLTKQPEPVVPPFYYRHTTKPFKPEPFKTANKPNKNIALIGGGIASAALCYSLAKRGFNITLYCKDAALAQGASQNKQAALYPLLQGSFDNLSEFYAQAYGYALTLYHQLLRQNLPFEHSFCGVLIQAFNDKVKQRQQSLIDNQLWPPSLLRPVTREQASDIANITLPQSGLYFADGGWINPESLINALLKASNALTTVDIQLNSEVTSLAQNNDQRWQLVIDGQTSAPFDQLVICSGHLASQFEQTQALALSPIRGQVSHLPATADTEKLATVLCYSGYITPAAGQQHSLGASFIKGDDHTDLRPKDHQKNVERLKECLSNHNWVDQLPIPDQGRAAIRCASIDHLPLAGAVPNYQQYREVYRDLWKGLRLHHYKLPPDYQNLFVLTALGARGLCSAPLCAEVLTAQICNEPYPVSQRVLNALNPGRGYIKALKRRT
ncbi:MAG: tRNA 5-methylaminomethyl-2-thiouridine biosynthesis bifunctional protein [Phenylobacterium sp.]|jgi:tRNA 5-methylaminomethyl-2-thiouridine biosynthesis bifunctional protein